MVVGIEDYIFWELTPKSIQIYFKAYQERRKTAIQDLWLQGQYFACAIQSTLHFGKGQPPKYPEMPFKDDAEKELAKDEKWLQAERQRAFNHFWAILSKNKNK